ncbi:MAG: DUF1800 domain-containing protein [Alphaproteobacteria bacterium]|nr:DUF1800 domain-containing protein [Alphaproteobacteria bacterium]
MTVFARRLASGALGAACVRAVAALAVLAGAGALGAAVAAGSARAQTLTFEESRHLLQRTGFAVDPAEAQRLTRMTREAAVKAVLDNVRREPVTPLPDSVRGAMPDKLPRDMTDAERQAFQQMHRALMADIKGWWLKEMTETPSPLTERMVLFWHGHFTSDLKKTKAPRLLLRQQGLLRREATGSFARLLHAIVKDPAMLVYLDGVENRRDAPNENLARELLELFTLGEGQYGERDIKEAARALTGWHLDRAALLRGGDAAFEPRRHDDGEKTVLGRRGRFDAAGLVDLLLAQPRTAEHVVEKLWREFVSPAPDKAIVARVAGRFRASGYEIRAALEGLLLSDAFWASANRGTLIKSPAVLLAGTVRQLGMALPDGRLVARASQRLGQDLFDPPNVKGWPGGETWITSDTLLFRHQVLTRLMKGAEMAAGPRPVAAQMMAMREGAPVMDLQRWFDSLPPELRTPEGLARLLLPLPPVAPPPSRLTPLAALSALLLDPTYQLM